MTYTTSIVSFKKAYLGYSDGDHPTISQSKAQTDIEIYIRWVVCRLRGWTSLKRCSKCLWYEHLAKACTSAVNRSDRCTVCWRPHYPEKCQALQMHPGPRTRGLGQQAHRRKRLVSWVQRGAKCGRKMRLIQSNSINAESLLACSLIWPTNQGSKGAGQYLPERKVWFCYGPDFYKYFTSSRNVLKTQ